MVIVLNLVGETIESGPEEIRFPQRGIQAVL
jgi:hypothetical protein